ncbi:MAG: citrate synthase [Rubrivivax sp.]
MNATVPAPRATRLLDSRQAAALLGIKLETLYAYVSRGLLKGRMATRGQGRRFHRDELEALRARRSGAAAQALRYGEPVLETRLTRMTPQGPAYRDRLATQLAADGTPYEAVAEWLWSGDGPEAAPRWPAPGRWPQARLLLRLLPPGSPPLAALALALPALAATDPLRFDTDPQALMARARVLIPQLAAAVALATDARRLAPALAAGDTVSALAIALGVAPEPEALDLLRCALVLCADHELNASTFAARVAASTGADLHACLGAALAALSGPRHGGASEQVEQLMHEAGRPARAAATVAARLRRGERLPGFGHPLYPDGDPRAAMLMARAAALGARQARLRTLLALADAMRDAGRPAPNLDVSLAATCAALRLPPGMGPALFALGRVAGWVAHVLEQQESGTVLRPRARYVGEATAR